MKRAIVGIAVAAYFVVVAIWLWTDPRAKTAGAAEYSALNASPDGLSLAFGYLQRHARHGASILTRAIDPQELQRDAVILRVHPEVESIFALLARDDEDDADDGDHQKDRDAKPSSGTEEKTKRAPTKVREPLLSASEEEWVANGGRIVLALADRFGPIEVSDPIGATTRKVFPMWPGLAEPGAESPRAISGLPRAHAIFVAGARPVVVRLTIGKGDVIIFGSPEAFANRNIGATKNLLLLETLTGARHVYFDETIHGIRSDAGLLELLKLWGLGPFVLLLIAAFIARVWRNGKRVGPPEPPPADVRSEAVDLVASLGELYTRSLRRRELLELYRRNLVSAVAAHTSLRGEALERRVSELLPLPADKKEQTEAEMPKAIFQHQLQLINDAFWRLDAKRR